MSFRVPLRLLSLSLVLASAAVAVAWTNPSARLGSPAGFTAAGEDLEEIMHGIDKNFEAVIAALEKKETAVALELMTKMQQACIGAKTLTPPKIKIVEDKDKPAFVAGFRKGVLTLLKSFADLEMALVDGDLEKAKKITDEIDALQKASHDVYKKMPRKK